MHPERPTSILVIADRALAREVMVPTLMAMGAYELDACSLDADELARGYAPQPAVALLVSDGSEPRIAETVGRLRVLAPAAAVDVPLVCLAGLVDPFDARRALELGVAGYVTLVDGMAALADAVVHAIAGETYVGSSVGVALAREGDASGLSPRESDLLRLLALGYTNAEAAHELNYSVRTVESDRAGLCRRLGIGTRRELVRTAIDRGLLRGLVA